jgi:hypothetical protein
VHEAPVRIEALRLLGDSASLSATSRATGVARSTIRSWAASIGAGPTDCCRCLGASPSTGSPYAALLGFYLGDGGISTYRRHTTIRVSCDARLPGTITDVSRALRLVRPASVVSHIRAPGVIVVQSNWKHWPCLFPQHGPGRKHERAIVLEEWQREVVRAFPADFLRGLFHSDGCRVNNWATRVVSGEKKRYDYPRWQFVNASEDILGLCTWALDLVEVPWRRSGARVVSVSRKDAVARLDELIGVKE